MFPSPVKPAYSISATSSGFSQWMLAASRGAPGPMKGDSSVSNALSLGIRRETTSRPNPVPIRPTCTSLPSRMTPAISERNALSVVVQPPSTTSCPERHLDFSQVSPRPEQ